MILVTRYTTTHVFTLGELRAIVKQQEGLPDDCEVCLWGQSADAPDRNEDVIQIN